MLVGYMRVSTDSDRQVLDLQRDALVAAGVDERHLFEDRVSGSRGDRTGLAKALAFIKSGDCLVVWKLDRLGRSLPHLLTTVTDLKKRGIAFRSLTEQMDTTTPQGEFLFHIFGALAQFERSLIQERVQAGLVAARRRGRRGGRPAAIDAEKVAAVIATYENQQHRASGLNLVVTAIILWNTRYLERAVVTLRQAAVDVPDELLAHLSPLGWEHVNLTGDYVWGGQHSMSENTGGLRALRTPQEALATAA
jgi:DNA invertase Pin-like site-specific DNA recombinase